MRPYRLASDRFVLFLIAVLVAVTALVAAGTVSRSWFPAKYVRLRLQGLVIHVVLLRSPRLASRSGSTVRRSPKEIAWVSEPVEAMAAFGCMKRLEVLCGRRWRGLGPAATASTFHEAGDDPMERDRWPAGGPDSGR